MTSHGSTPAGASAAFEIMSETKPKRSGDATRGCGDSTGSHGAATCGAAPPVAGNGIIPGPLDALSGAGRTTGGLATAPVEAKPGCAVPQALCTPQVPFANGMFECCVGGLLAM
mmetsp:Transcript_19050/g.39690  ORF Transcript_19050/g.39690 Transcript_19050/m.39690 type:complete len:114 (+) Transcript_19050:196-537(+)